MKIATFNINNVNKRLANLAAWLRQAGPDVACLQELKATDSEFPVTAIKKAGYEAVWRGEKSWNGVAILGRPEATSPDTSGWGKVMAPMYKVIALQHSTVKPSSEIPCE